MTEALIGVIVPVYKVEKYIAECIESILAQTYTNFRLILVDDGTPDNAGNICDEYARKDSRITVIHQENAGVTRARARGVEEASDCEFITFVDGDDTLTPNSLEYLQSHYNKYKSGIIISPADSYVPKERGYLPAAEYRKLLLRDVSLCNSPWGKLIKRSLFKKETFEISREIAVGEDLLMNLHLAFSNNATVTVVKENTYNYRIHPESTMHLYRRSPASEELFYKHLRKIIPAEEWHSCAPLTIGTRYIRFKWFCDYKYNVKNIYSSAFYTHLREDIEQAGYNIRGLEKILFYNDNIVIRFIAINFKKCRNLINRFCNI